MIINSSTLTSGIKVIPSDSINIPGTAVKFEGVTTADLTSKLQDTSAPLRGGFVQTLKSSPNENQVLNQGVQVGDVVYNMSVTRPGIAYVTAIDSNNTLSLSADIFPNAGADRDAYAIYEGNGINVDQDWGWKLVVGDIFPQVTSNDAAGFNAGADQAIVPSGGTYTGNATFTMTVSGGGSVTALDVATTGDFDWVDPVGKTIIFDTAAIEGVFGGGGSGSVTATFVEANTTYVNQPSELGQSKAFQLYIGGTGDAYITTNMGEEIFIESIPAGTVLPIAVARVNVGQAASGGTGDKNTLTTATEIVALT
tara:strand:+ start:208 stop:1137 length:930 start_codon:yes stop_codon:yes gene_type:complete